MKVLYVLNSVPRTYALAFVVVEFVLTCITLNEMNTGSSEHERVFQLWNASQVMKLIWLLIFGILLAALDQLQDMQDEKVARAVDIAFYIGLLFAVVWLFTDAITIGMFIYYIFALAGSWSAFLFALGIVNSAELPLLFFACRWSIHTGNLRINWGGLAKTNATGSLPEFTDPVQKFVYMHLPTALAHIAGQPLHVHQHQHQVKELTTTTELDV